MASKRQAGVLCPFQAVFNEGSFTGMSDGELLDRFLARTDARAEVAFAALMAMHGPMVWNVCRGILSDPHAAEDAFQATFLILARKAGSIRRRETVGPWLHGVARRVAVRARAVGRRGRPEVLDPAMKQATAPDPASRERLDALHEEVGRLPEKYRSVVVLCHLEGRTHAQAARLLGCPVGTVSIRASRAKELLRERLTRRGLAPSVLLLSGPRIGPEVASMPARLVESTCGNALRMLAGKPLAAGSVPATVAPLIKGESFAMMPFKSIAVALGLMAAGATVWGLSPRGASGPPGRAPQAAVQPPENPPPNVEALRARSLNNCKYFGLAINNYAIQHDNRFPPAAIRDRDGKPLLSWRVAILPCIDEEALYREFHLDEPWDSPHNRTLLTRMPALYAPVVPGKESKDSTYYQVFVGKGTLFEDDRGATITSIRDGAAWTLAVVEGARPVPWTRPDDLPYDKDQPLPALGGQFEKGFSGVFADGSARFFSKDLDPAIIRALITRDGGEVIGGTDLR
jgi:RNA polymerase sigma factor (sigma-70 family)